MEKIIWIFFIVILACIATVCRSTQSETTPASETSSTDWGVAAAYAAKVTQGWSGSTTQTLPMSHVSRNVNVSLTPVSVRSQFTDIKVDGDSSDSSYNTTKLSDYGFNAETYPNPDTPGQADFFSSDATAASDIIKTTLLADTSSSDSNDLTIQSSHATGSQKSMQTDSESSTSVSDNVSPTFTVIQKIIFSSRSEGNEMSPTVPAHTTQSSFNTSTEITSSPGTEDQSSKWKTDISHSVIPTTVASSDGERVTNLPENTQLHSGSSTLQLDNIPVTKTTDSKTSPALFSEGRVTVVLETVTTDLPRDTSSSTREPTAKSDSNVQTDIYHTDIDVRTTDLSESTQFGSRRVATHSESFPVTETMNPETSQSLFSESDISNVLNLFTTDSYRDTTNIPLESTAQSTTESFTFAYTETFVSDPSVEKTDFTESTQFYNSISNIHLDSFPITETVEMKSTQHYFSKSDVSQVNTKDSSYNSSRESTTETYSTEPESKPFVQTETSLSDKNTKTTEEIKTTTETVFSWSADSRVTDLPENTQNLSESSTSSLDISHEATKTTSERIPQIACDCNVCSDSERNCSSISCYYSFDLIKNVSTTGCNPILPGETKSPDGSCSAAKFKEDMCQFCCSQYDNCNRKNAEDMMRECINIRPIQSHTSRVTGYFFVAFAFTLSICLFINVDRWN